MILESEVVLLMVKPVTWTDGVYEYTIVCQGNGWLCATL